MIIKKIGFIGAGNMSYAIIGGLLKAKLTLPENIVVSNRSPQKLERFQKEFGITVAKDSKELARQVDFLVMAVKPNVFDEVAKDILPDLKKDVVIISIAAGKSIEAMETIFGKDKKIVRTMPNTPSLANEGMSALCSNENVTGDEMSEVEQIFNSFGKSQRVSESMFHSVIGVAGSSPAYVFMFIEAMADAAVVSGMPRDQAYAFASQAVYGAAKLVMETGIHPGELKDMVCSPGGTTIEAVVALEKNGFRGAVIEGVNACIAKSIAMENNDFTSKTTAKKSSFKT